MIQYFNNVSKYICLRYCVRLCVECKRIYAPLCPAFPPCKKKNVLLKEHILFYK